jgi:hypothetical protein
MLVVVDTNIFLYATGGPPPEHEASIELLSLRCELCISGRPRSFRLALCPVWK